MEEKTLQQYAEIAHEYLNNSNTAYARNKKIISEAFENTNSNYCEETIAKRLLYIDSMYSTQMNRRYFGIEDLAKEIFKLGTEEYIVKNLFLEFTKNQDIKNIKQLFLKQYGINKNGKKGGVATSLITKYAYFQTNYQFPIYDRLVLEMIPKFSPANAIESSDISEILNFIKKVNDIKELVKINDFDTFDNLLWLSGKICNNSFGLILPSQEVYKRFIELVQDIYKTEIETEKIINKKGKAKSKPITHFIQKYLSEHLPELRNAQIFDEKLIDIIEFTTTKIINN